MEGFVVSASHPGTDRVGFITVIPYWDEFTQHGKSLRGAPYLTSAWRMKALFRTMSDRMTIAPEYASYIADPTEMWVRVESLKDFLGKENIDRNDLDIFLSKDIRSVPNDITFFHTYMQETSYDDLTEIAAAMNGVL